MPEMPLSAIRRYEGNPDAEVVNKMVLFGDGAARADGHAPRYATIQRKPLKSDRDLDRLSVRRTMVVDDLSL